MKKTSNLRSIILGISFLFWLFGSMVIPIKQLFNQPTTFDYVFGANALIIISFIFINVVPKAIKKPDSFSNLNFRTGSTKDKTGCTSCKRKKRS